MSNMNPNNEGEHELLLDFLIFCTNRGNTKFFSRQRAASPGVFRESGFEAIHRRIAAHSCMCNAQSQAFAMPHSAQNDMKTHQKITQ
jgi:hypothetical protein